MTNVPWPSLSRKAARDRKSTRLNSSHRCISYAVFCLKKKKRTQRYETLARRSVGARMLLVTATPMCNSACERLALIDLIVSGDAVASSCVTYIDVGCE